MIGKEVSPLSGHRFFLSIKFANEWICCIFSHFVL